MRLSASPAVWGEGQARGVVPARGALNDDFLGCTEMQQLPTYAQTTCPQVLAELRELIDYRKRTWAAGGGGGGGEGGAAPPQILALGLSSRKNLCIHPRVVGAPLMSAPSLLLLLSCGECRLNASTHDAAATIVYFH